MGYKTPQEVFHSFEIEKFAEKIAPLFKHNDWQWHFSIDGIPSASDIAATLHSLAWECLRSIEKCQDPFDNKAGCTSTGRLQVRIVRYASGWSGTLEVVPDWQNA